MKTIFTIGHSTRTLDEFVEMLQSHGVKVLADVRAIPRSKRLPWFNDDSLQRELPKFDIIYMSFKSLGGRRRTTKDSINTGWRNESFRGYADYMQTGEFTAAVENLIDVAKENPTAIMCAEAVPWRCHRSLIGDALLARKWKVLDIMSSTNAREHKMTDFAKVDGKIITYPGLF